jgi:hypothetical protein
MKKKVFLAAALCAGFVFSAFAQTEEDFKFFVDTVDHRIIAYYTGSTRNVVIPARLGNLPVTQIWRFAFAGRWLKNVTIPNGVTVIGGYAFAGNLLTSVVIPNSVTFIAEGAFQDNELTSVTIPNSVTIIGDGAFRNNQLTSVTIPNSVIDIGDRAFDGNIFLVSITIGANVSITDLIFHPFDKAFYRTYTANEKRAGRYERVNNEWYWVGDR